MASNHYDFFEEEFDEGSAYAFLTDNHKLYTVYFDPSAYADYLQHFPFLLANGYALGFYFQQLGEKSVRNADGNISSTICRIIRDFLDDKHPNTILLFHCDPNDKRQAYRHKLFNDWHNEYSDSAIQMRSIKVEINNKDCHYLGIITNASNPNIDKATGELEQLAVELVASINSK